MTAVNPEAEQGWVGYTFALLLFSVAGALATYAIERVQNILPFNPQGLDAVAPDLAFNTAVSFTTIVLVQQIATRTVGRGAALGRW